MIRDHFITAMTLALGASIAIGCSSSHAEETGASVTGATPEAVGRHIVILGGCNDCHTVGWDQRGAEVPETEWLTGNVLGWRGPWGTTYPPNLRLTVQNYPEDGFVQMVRTRNERPPMPWQNLHLMSDRELRAVYRYIKSLGPAGVAAPDYLPPSEVPEPPYVQFVLPGMNE